MQFSMQFWSRYAHMYVKVHGVRCNITAGVDRAAPAPQASSLARQNTGA